MTVFRAELDLTQPSCFMCIKTVTWRGYWTLLAPVTEIFVIVHVWHHLPHYLGRKLGFCSCTFSLNVQLLSTWLLWVKKVLMFPYSYCGKVYLEWKAFYYYFMTVNFQLGVSLFWRKMRDYLQSIRKKNNVAMFFTIYFSVAVSGSSYIYSGRPAEHLHDFTDVTLKT